MSIFATSTAAFFDRSTQNLSALRGQAEELQNQISSNSKITRSSDDPLAASQLRALARAESIGTIDTAATNRATVDLNLTDTALNQFATYVSRAQELATQAASSLLPAAQRASIASELAQIHKGLVGLANTRDSAGHALFGGDSPGDAYQINAAGQAQYIGSGSAGQLSLGDGQTVSRSLTGPEFLSFKDPAGNQTDLMTVIKSLSDANVWTHRRQPSFLWSVQSFNMHQLANTGLDADALLSHLRSASSKPEAGAAAITSLIAPTGASSSAAWLVERLFESPTLLPIRRPNYFVHQ